MLGRTIKEFRIMSFYRNLKCVCDITALYIKVETGDWYKLRTSDGVNFMELLNEEPLEVRLDQIDDEFAFPVRSIQSKYIEKTIVDIKQYAYNKEPDSLSGFYLHLSDNLGFSLFSEDICLEMSDNIRITDNYFLI